MHVCMHPPDTCKNVYSKTYWSVYIYVTCLYIYIGNIHVCRWSNTDTNMPYMYLYLQIRIRIWPQPCWTVNWQQVVMVMPVRQRQRLRLCPTKITFVPVLQIREIMPLWALFLHIFYLTDTEMSIQEIVWYRAPIMWTIYTYACRVYLWSQTLYSHFQSASMCQEKYFEICPQVCFYLVDQ